MTTLTPEWDVNTPHEKIIKDIKLSKKIIREWFRKKEFSNAAEAAHLVVDKKAKKAFYRDEQGIPNLEVNSVRPIKRIGPDGQILADLVIEITQSRRGYYKEEDQKKADSGVEEPKEPDFVFRGGCTLLVEIKTANVKYCIYKDINSDKRLEYVRKYLSSDGTPSLRKTYFGEPKREYFKRFTSFIKEPTLEFGVEPFSLIHRSFQSEEVS